jgi:hypothetical protein
MVGDPVLAKSDQTFYQAFNTASVAPVPYAACEKANPDAICWGNAPKYSFRGPGINSWDTSLFKNFSLTERLRAQFRAEFYNVFNHTNFNGVDTSAKFNAAGAQTNLTFGQYSSAQFPRRIQLALRLMF